MILACAEGGSVSGVAAKLAATRPTIGKWRSRLLRQRLDGLLDVPRPGAPRQIGDDAIEDVVRRTLETRPSDATHWSTRTMAEHVGLSHTTVMRIWQAFGLEPHRTETFKLSKDPLFIEKVRDIIGGGVSEVSRSH